MHSRYHIVYLLALLLMLTSSGFAQSHDQNGYVFPEKWKQRNQERRNESRKSADVESQKSGFPSSLLKMRIKYPKAKTPQEAMEAFLIENRGALGISGERSDLLLTRSEQDPVSNFTRFRYQQVYDGLPVANGALLTDVSEDLEIISVDNKIRPIRVEGYLERPKSSERAISAAVSEVLSELPTGASVVQNGPQVPSAKLVVRVIHGIPTAEWVVTFATEKPAEDWLVHVEAESNRVVEITDTVSF